MTDDLRVLSSIIEYRVHLVTDLADPTDDEFDVVLEALTDVSGVPSAPAGALAVTVSADAADALGAVERAQMALSDALRAIGRTARVVAIEASSARDQDRAV